MLIGEEGEGRQKSCPTPSQDFRLPEKNEDDEKIMKYLTEKREIEKKLEQKKDENTADILAYMESQRGLVCEIIGKGLTALNDPEKLAEATPAQITTALGTLIDKWASISGGPADKVKEDGLSQSLREMAEELESDT